MFPNEEGFLVWERRLPSIERASTHLYTSPLPRMHLTPMRLPVGSDLEPSIEPVLASSPPPHSVVDPPLVLTSLHELPEQDEEKVEERFR